MEVFHKYIGSPIGVLKISSDMNSLISVSFEEKMGEPSLVQPIILEEAIAQLMEYFKGKRKSFDLKLNPSGTTFQENIWKLVESVAYGETASYLEIAKKSGSVTNTRAVGMANGKNPIPIIIPCHRIIGSNGKLTGYAGGLDRKRWLLKHEMQYSDYKSLLF